MELETIREDILVVLFCLDEPRYALRLSEVVRVLPAIEIIPLPNAPEKILGVINLHGEIIPAIGVRFLFGVGNHALKLSDHLLVVQLQNRRIALLVDSVEGVMPLNNIQKLDHPEMISASPYLSGTTLINDTIVFISDLRKFLSQEEEQQLDAALERRSG